MVRIVLAGLGVLGLAMSLRAADVLPPASERFAAADGGETPSFQRHVVPLLGRLGCNGRACHGSFQGQGGFRLSLFGYDFKADHDALTAGAAPRVDRNDPSASLMLQKPTRTVAHKGGKRIEPGSWQHHLLLRWVRAGAAGVRESHHREQRMVGLADSSHPTEKRNPPDERDCLGRPRPALDRRRCVPE